MRHILIALVIGIFGLVAMMAFRPSPPDLDSPPILQPLEDTITRISVGVCIWQNTGLRETPGRRGKRITSVDFGERVELLGESKEAENRKYIKIRLSDQKEGWVYQYLIAQKAILSVVVKPADIFRRPDMMTRKDEKFEKGDIVAATEIKEGKKGLWIKVTGPERKKNGWIQSVTSLSANEKDIIVAQLYQQALKEEEVYAQRKALVTLLANEELKNASLIDMVEQSLSTVGLKARIPEDKLYITSNLVNMRTVPKKDEGQVVRALEEGAICEVLSIGKKESIGKMYDYWYEIGYQGESGWVYGHFTSKKQD